MGSRDFGSLLRAASDAAKDVARSSSDALSSDPRTADHFDRARRGAETAMRSLDSTRRRITQEEAWAECSQAIEDVVDVLVVQQRMIEALTDKVAALEAERSATAAR